MTAPEDTVKSAGLNDATPLLLVVASSPEISPAMDISIPSPAEKAFFASESALAVV